jgi:hypothetical protein
VTIRILALSLAGALLPSQAFSAAKLQELREKHFIVHYEKEEAYARRLLRQAERLYATIMRNLGHDQIAKPWLGDRRCKITIYKDQETFLENVPGIDWAEGIARYETREIFVFYGKPNLISNVLPHEIAHLLFREIMGGRTKIALWLQEGVALSQEPDLRESYHAKARKAFEDGTFIPFEEMNAIEKGSDLDKTKAEIFYPQALATVNFLRESFHQKKFLKFCELLREGKDVPTALKGVYGRDRIQSLRDLQNSLQDYL